MMGKENTYLASAYKQLQVISQDEQKRMEYTARLKEQLDQNQIIWEAEKRERIKNIRNMIKNMGVSAEQAMSVLEVPEDERQQYKDLLEQNIPKE